MRFSKTKSDDVTLLINENGTKKSPISSSPQRDPYSSIQCHTLRQDHMPNSLDKPSPPAEYVYTEIVKAIGNNEFIEEKRLLKRASWNSVVLQEQGLPPTGKRTSNEQLSTNKTPNRVRMRPKAARYYQPQQYPQQHQMPFERPVSFNERYNRHLIDPQQRNLSNSSLVSFAKQHDLKYIFYVFHSLNQDINILS
jgi:hypothetical protein